MTNILQQIIARKKKEVAEAKSTTSISSLEQMPFFERNTISLTGAIRKMTDVAIIAEFKRQSPSRGIIHENAQALSITKGYALSGACGLSVLTDEHFFGGSLQDLEQVRGSSELPVLRKDFIVDEFQLLQARAAGADVILLIAAALTPSEVRRFAGLARSLGLQVLLEVHERQELEVLNTDVDIIGVNNRDLRSFQTDIRRSVELLPAMPADITKISESGIENASDLRLLKNAGFDAFLIGDLFMRNAQPADALHQLINNFNEKN